MLSKYYPNVAERNSNAIRAWSECTPSVAQAHPKRKPLTQPRSNRPITAQTQPECALNTTQTQPECATINPSGNQAQPQVRGVYDFKAIAAASAGKISSPLSNSQRQCRFSVRFQVRCKASCALPFIFPDVNSWPCQTGIAQNAFAARREKVQSTVSDPNSGAGKSIS